MDALSDEREALLSDLRGDAFKYAGRNPNGWEGFSEGTNLLAAEKIFINTGACPAEPRIPGLDTVPTFDSSSIIGLETLPEHMLVMGGGYIGRVFGQMFRRFGSRVTFVHRRRSSRRPGCG